MNDALKGMNELLDTLPISDKNFELARTSIKKDIETERTTKDEIVFTYLANRDKGLDSDPRKAEYAALDTMKVSDIQDLHDRQIAHKPYTYCIVGSDKKISEDDLKKVGELKKLSLEDVFGY
jgi:predicted Zn-dependent peptidase